MDKHRAADACTDRIGYDRRCRKPPEDTTMAKIRHIAIQTQDEEATKQFYVENFGLKVIRKLESARTSGYFLTDGHINLAILRFKNDVIAGAERGAGWSGIHHIGFEVESLEETAAQLERTGAAKPRADINVALGLGAGGAPAGHGNVEVRYLGPDNVNFDISQTGWDGTHGEKSHDEKRVAETAAS
jgi:catechol 2,3-dioxygenase-like lactoylglutathione lyase family enzyme